MDEPKATVDFGGVGTLEGGVVVGDQDNSIDNSTHVAGDVDTLEQGNRNEIGGDLNGDVAQVNSGEITQTYYDQMLETLTNDEAKEQYINIAKTRSEVEGLEVLPEAVKADMLAAASSFSNKAKQAVEVPETVDKSDLVHPLENMGKISGVLASKAIKLINLDSATRLVKLAVAIVLPTLEVLAKR